VLIRNSWRLVAHHQWLLFLLQCRLELCRWMQCIDLVKTFLLDLFFKYTTTNVWINHYNKPPNSTLGGLHMIWTTNDFVKWASPIRISPKWSCNERQLWFEIFLPEMPLGMVENFPLDLFKLFGWLSESMIRWYHKEHHTLIFQNPSNFGKI
jgi:hypothetical protein